MLSLTNEEKWMILKNRSDYPTLARIIEAQNRFNFKKEVQYDATTRTTPKT